MIDPVWIFALVIAGVGAGWVLFELLRLAWRMARRGQHRLFDRIQPSRWPKVDTETRRQLRKWDVR